MSSSGTEFLTPLELSRRWKGMIGIGTLANWRAARKGPRYVKVGGRVLYKLDDVLEWERRANGAQEVVA